jgi:chemotaxis protein methyltransferase CheR
MTEVTREFQWIQNFMKKESGIILDAGKEYLVESRLLSVARREKLDVWALVARASKTRPRPIHAEILDALTTNETSFYRDLHPFKLFEEKLIPEIVERRSKEKTLTIACAACSSGQEPYSIAMLLREKFPVVCRDWKITIHAWDLCSQILAEAKEAKYGQLAVNRGLPVRLLMKYFTKDGSTWQLKPEIRDMITFQRMNLTHPWPVGRGSVDILFMRNVLIYFDIETKKGILERGHKALRTGGSLFLGGAETTLNLDPRFRRFTHNKGSCYQLGNETRSDKCFPKMKFAS